MDARGEPTQTLPKGIRAVGSAYRERHPTAYFAGMADAFILLGLFLLAAGTATFALYFANFSEAFLFLLPALILPVGVGFLLYRFLPPHAPEVAAAPSTFTAPVRKGT